LCAGWVETFLAHTRETYEEPLPRYVEQELGGYLCCGVFAYGFVRAHWRHGFATEAAGAVVNAAFQSCGDLTRLRAMADARNHASIRVLDKIMRHGEGLLRSNRFVHDEFIDEVWYGLLRPEWNGS
jgi:RimJ/RimL family protein N-acetyltransferase